MRVQAAGFYGMTNYVSGSIVKLYYETANTDVKNEPYNRPKSSADLLLVKHKPLL